MKTELDVQLRFGKIQITEEIIENNVKGINLSFFFSEISTNMHLHIKGYGLFDENYS